MLKNTIIFERIFKHLLILGNKILFLRVIVSQLKILSEKTSNYAFLLQIIYEIITFINLQKLVQILFVIVK